MHNSYLYYICYASILACVICTVYRYKVIDTATKFLGVLMMIDLINEVTAFYVGMEYGNNMPVNNIHSIIEFIFICLYFNYSIDTFIKKRTGYYLAGLGVILGIANLIFLQDINNLNSYFLIFEGACIIGMSLYAFFRLLADHDTLRLYRHPHFWFTTILLFFWSTTFFNWVLYDYLNAQYASLSWVFNLCILAVNFLMYAGISCVLILYPKM